MSCWRPALFAGLLLSLCGCGANTHTVSGRVTFNGEPVAEGHIGFEPAGTGGGSGGTITDGHYSVAAAPGENKVRITASKMMPLPPGKKGMYGNTEEVQQYIPTKYNTETELKCDVQGPTTLDFDLKSR